MNEDEEITQAELGRNLAARVTRLEREIENLSYVAIGLGLLIFVLIRQVAFMSEANPLLNYPDKG